MSRVVAVLLAGLAAAAITAIPTAATAAAPRADLAIAASPVGGKVGQAVDVRYVIRNNGPNAVLPLSWVVDVVAPAGTQIVSAGTGACEVVTAGHHLRCRYGFALNVDERHSLALRVRIEKAPTGCGRLTLTYSDDPRPGNNASNVRVTVDGLPANCAATASPSPSPKPTKTRASASPSALPSEEPEPTADESSSEETYAPLTPAGGGDDSGMGIGSILVLGGGAVLVALGGVLVWRLLRKDPDEDYYDHDATGPIYR